MQKSIRYTFNQRFHISAQEAFNWCTDFEPEDHVLMGDTNAERQVVKITDSTIILKEKFYSADRIVEKEKLVQLYPEKFFWVSTHLTGPNKHSQFLYNIIPENDSTSFLQFTGLHLDYESTGDTAALARTLCEDDANAWKLLAKAMERDLKT